MNTPLPQMARDALGGFITALNRGSRAAWAMPREPLAPAYGPLNKGQTVIGVDLALDDSQVMSLTAAIQEIDGG